MQKIVHTKDYKSLHPLMDEFERFYSATSENSLQFSNSLVPMVFDESFEKLQGIFNIYGDNDYHFSFTDKHYEQLVLPKYDSNNIIVAFSGGKDSVASALICKSCGFNVYLYHLRGLKNKTYPDEWKSAQEIADYLGLPLIIEDIKLEGALPFSEHPMKNMIIANHMLQWGIQNNIGTNITFGNYMSSVLEFTAFYYSGDDCMDMWEEYERIIGKIIPGFQMTFDLAYKEDALEEVATDVKLLGMCKSCLGANRFRAYNHRCVEEKYGIKLLPDRCGVCWKCAVEYIYMTDHDVLEYNESYYKKCVDVLKKADLHENERPFENIKMLWEDYFSYDMKQSKWADIVNYGKRKRMK